MNNKKQLTKVSVLIDKLNYLNDNLELNTLKVNDLDFQLLKNYTAELWQVLQTVENEVGLSQQNQIVKEQLFDQLPKIEPQIIEKIPQPAISNISESKASHIHPVPEKRTDEITKPKYELPVAKTELDKDATDNIFDTVKAIKKQQNIELEPKVEPIQAKSEPELQALPNKPIEKVEALKPEKKEEVKAKSFEFMPSTAKETIAKSKSIELNEDLAQQLHEEEQEQNANPSLNDRFKKKDGNLATVIKAGNNRNFKELIDINDRFLFIQSLFGGSYLAFEEAVKQINKIESYSEALDYVDYKLKGTYDWSTDSTEVTKFLNILERSYA